MAATLNRILKTQITKSVLNCLKYYNDKGNIVKESAKNVRNTVLLDDKISK